jgi:hypothetical protein
LRTPTLLAGVPAEEEAPNRDAQIIAVGGGASTLIDDLLPRTYHKLSLLDVSPTALDVAKETSRMESL